MDRLRPREPARHRRADFAAVFPRQFLLLAAGAFVLLCGIDMCYPFETRYLNGRLGVSMTVIGLVQGLPLIASLPLFMLGGALTDRWGRKPVMAVGVTVIVGLYLTFALASSLWAIAIAVALEAAFGWAMYLTGSNAMTADLVRFERRAEAYSILRVTQHVGMVAGPLAAAALLTADPTYRSNFIAAAAVCALFVAILLALFRETRPANLAGERFTDTLRGYRAVMGDRRFLVFCGVELLPLYIFGQIWSTLPVLLGLRHGVSAPTWALLVTFYAACVAVFQYPLVRGLRRRNHLVLIALGSTLMGVGFAGAILAPYGGLTLLFIFLLGQGVVFLIPVSSSVAAEMAPLELRGRYMGVWTLVQMGGYALGPTFGGWAMDGLGSTGAALIGGLSGLLGAAALLIMARRVRAPVFAVATAMEELPPPEPPGA